MKNNKIKALTEGALCVALATILTLIGIYVPILSLPSILISGVPLAYLGMKYGMRISATAFIATSIIIFILSGTLISGVVTSLMSLLPGVIAGFTFFKRFSFKRSVVFISAAVLLGLGLELYLLNMVDGGNGFTNLINQSFDILRDTFLTTIDKLSTDNPDEAKKLLITLNEVVDLAKARVFLYTPSFVVGTAFTIGYLIYVVTIFILNRVKVGKIEYLKFNQIRATKMLCYGSVILSVATMMMDSETIVFAGLKNIDALINCFIGLCGFTLIDYIFAKKISSGYGRAGVYAVVCLFGYLFLGFVFRIFTFIGFIDGIFNIRSFIGWNDNNVKS